MALKHYKVGPIDLESKMPEECEDKKHNNWKLRLEQIQRDTSPPDDSIYKVGPIELESNMPEECEVKKRNDWKLRLERIQRDTCPPNDSIH